MTTPVLLRGGTVVDGTGSAPQPNTDVLLDGDAIVAVGTNIAPGVTDREVTTIDVTGCTVMPGLIDAHCHITFGEPRSNDELFFHRSSATAMALAAFNVQKLLRAGVTGFLDADCIFDLGPALRDAIEAGLVEGPRMTAGMNALLTAAAGTAGRLIPDEGTIGYAQVVRDRDEMVRTTRQQVKYGADWIKMYGSTGSDQDVTGFQTFTQEEMHAAVEIAHRYGKRVAIHSYGPEGAAAAVRAGADSVEHATDMDDATIAEMVKRGTVYVPTVEHNQFYIDHRDEFGYGPEVADGLRAYIRRNAETFVLWEAVRAGLRG